MERMPETPLLVAYQNASLPRPLGATTPRPVITTRRCGDGAMVFLPLQLPVKPVGVGENEDAVDAPKAARMGECYFKSRITRNVWHIIQVAAWIRLLLIDRRR